MVDAETQFPAEYKRVHLADKTSSFTQVRSSESDDGWPARGGSNRGSAVCSAGCSACCCSRCSGRCRRSGGTAASPSQPPDPTLRAVAAAAALVSGLLQDLPGRVALGRPAIGRFRPPRARQGLFYAGPWSRVSACARNNCECRQFDGESWLGGPSESIAGDGVWKSAHPISTPERIACTVVRST